MSQSRLTPILIALACCAVGMSAPPTANANTGVESEPAPAAVCKALLTSDFSMIRDAPTQLTDAQVVNATDSKPAYCRVQGYVAPQVGFELWLPASRWNGKVLEVGCGGFCGDETAKGFIQLCNDPVHRGYACILSDMGHKGTGADGLWAYNNLQAQVDYGFRATHVAALVGRAISEHYYGKTASRSYYLGCSCGGRQGLVEAQQFPWDFDGIIVGVARRLG